ncbi:MAG: TraB/GumN family protein [Bacteroidota bacterium]
MRQEKINTVTKKEMPTIMDAYLFGIAKRHGKWVGGIEDVQDQLAIYDEIGREVSRDELLTTDDKLKAMIDEMVSIYLDQDLDKIENYFSHKSTEELQELLFIRRNIKMSRRIDSLSTIRTMFFAVGVAHLPGDSGVINLLKNKGYKVEPIFSTEKIDPEKYTSGLGKQPWVKTEDEKKTYTIEMPGKASDMDIFGELFKIKMYVDITTLTYFMSGSTITQNKVDPATMLEKFAMNITSGKVESKKMIEREGAKGIEGIIKAEGNYYKVQYLLKNNLVFMVMAGGQNRNLLESEDVKRYFQSFAINKDIQPKPDKEWSVFSLSEKAFSVMLPGLPKQNKTIEKKADGTTWSFTVYDYNDLSSGKYYMVQVRDLLPGYYLTGDSTYFSLFKENFVNSVKKVLREESIKIQTFPALRFDGISDEEQFSLATLNINRGNRIYSLMVVTTGKTTQDKQIEQFFNSFIITDYKASAWKKEWSPDMSFYTVVPYPITLKEKEETDSMNMEKSFYYLSFNPHEVVSYQVFKEPIPEYFWTGNDSLLFDHFGRAYKAYQDSILKKKSVMNGQLKGMEWVIQMPDNNNLKKVRQILNGDTLYTLISLIPSQYIERRDHQQFFDEFRLANESILSSVYQSKARKLLEALLSKDSATFTKASEAVSSAPFSREDLPLLHTAITRLYADDTSYNTRSKIVKPNM